MGNADVEFSADTGFPGAGTYRIYFEMAALLGNGLIQKESHDRPRHKLSLPPQYRVPDAQQAFPSFERHDPKRTCLLDYGPCLPACGIPKLAFYIRLRRASDDLRAHPHAKKC